MKWLPISASLALIAGCCLFGATAQAEPLTVSTDRVTIRVEDNGAVQIRSAGNERVSSSANSRPVAPRTLTERRGSRACQQITQRVQRQYPASGTGSDRIFTQSHSSTQICH